MRANALPSGRHVQLHSQAIAYRSSSGVLAVFGTAAAAPPLYA